MGEVLRMTFVNKGDLHFNNFSRCHPVSLTFKTFTVLHHKCVTTYSQIAQAQYKLF